MPKTGANHDFHNRLKDLKSLLEKAQRPAERTSFLICLGDIESILNKYVLDLLFQSFAPDLKYQRRDAAVELLLKRHPEDDTAAYCFLRSFATLLHYGDTKYIERAMEYFLNLTPRASGVWRQPRDDDLSADGFYSEEDYEAKYFFDRFFARKIHLCATVLREGQFHDISPHQLLPFELDEETPLGEGHAGRVYKAKIWRHHWRNPRLTNLEDMPVAVKRFSGVNPRHYFDHESQILMQLQNISVRSDNVLLPMASLVRGKECYLVYELAAMNLQEYIEDTPRKEPADSQYLAQTKATLESLTDLAGALNWIHGQKAGKIIWHRDIKPDNILVFRSKQREIWKLADFDRAASKNALSSSGELKMDREKEHTFRAPEVSDGGDGRRSDVWSLACVMIEVLSWLDNGVIGRNEFWNVRPIYYGSERSDVFYDRFTLDSTSDTGCILSQPVNQWLGQLIQRASERAKTEDSHGSTSGLAMYLDYIVSLVKRLTESAFIKLAGRAKSQELYLIMDNTFAECFQERGRSMSMGKTRRNISIRPFAPWNLSNKRKTPNLTTNEVSPSQSPVRTSQDSRMSIDQLSKSTTSSTNASTHLNKCLPLCHDIKMNKKPPKDFDTYTAADLNRICPACGHGLLHKAIRVNSRPWFEQLLNDRRININLVNDHGRKLTPVELSGDEGRMWAAEELLKRRCKKPREDQIKAISSETRRREFKRIIKHF